MWTIKFLMRQSPSFRRRRRPLVTAPPMATVSQTWPPWSLHHKTYLHISDLPWSAAPKRSTIRPLSPVSSAIDSTVQK
ncbi:hypothetical protein BD626DRAFT_274827 [Schizophyllum amplum]|uniref:Uncharacterized protein n=1 Tax=Schizophyllum amplum TaxID=97359 RepID=A0A550CG53_9AGAR|nr:hypothetical protein BD626DRAFT_274827 [Auriculariopsis ampla]